MSESERWMNRRQVARLFGVHTDTISRWVRTGRLPAIRTLGGHARFREADMFALTPSRVPPADEPPARRVVPAGYARSNRGGRA